MNQSNIKGNHMALKARDAKHAAQIKAGTTGQRSGLKFESTLRDRINSLKDLNFLNCNTPCTNIVDGKPEEALLYFIYKNKFSDKKITKVKCYWMGGHATSGKGDVIYDSNNNPIKACKSDIIIDFYHSVDQIDRVGVSVKTCNKKTPTNAQLYCSTALAFCELLRNNGITVTSEIETGLKKFCGNDQFRPIDILKKDVLKNRLSDHSRFYYEELGTTFHNELVELFKLHQDKITRLLLQKAYKTDPYPPSFVFHQRNKFTNINLFPMALFSIDELVTLSKKYCNFTLKDYVVNKGTWKNDPATHKAPRFGCVQFQRLGNKQNATQLQFNLEAAYFYKIIEKK